MAGFRKIPADAPDEPALIGAILDHPLTFLIARLALVSAYLLGASVKAFDFPGAVAEQAHFGLHPPAAWAMATLLTEGAGAILVMTRRWVWLGAGILGVFTVLAAIIANAFWTLPPGPERFMATNAFFEHLGLAGGFALAALVVRRSGRLPT